jgi:hypothetical protein
MRLQKLLSEFDFHVYHVFCTSMLWNICTVHWLFKQQVLWQKDEVSGDGRRGGGVAKLEAS